MRTLMCGGLHEIDLHLQRTLRDKAQQLSFRFNLLRHEIQDHQLERAHTLTLRFGLFQRENALGVENVSGRKAAGNLDRHASIMVRGRIWRTPLRRRSVETGIGKMDNALFVALFYTAKRARHADLTYLEVIVKLIELS